MPAQAEAQEKPGGSVQTAFELAAQQHGYRLDSAQQFTIAAFERLYRELIDSERGGLSLLRLFQRSQPIAGIYLWGGVGRGKSFLMDCFYEAVPLQRKRRVHFHRFMQDVHKRLKVLQGEQEPLQLIGREMSRATRLLCLDEFQITDIGDAMIMRNLLDSVFAHGVALVTTSNQHPDALYRYGLQRAQFLPAIELIKKHMQVTALDGNTDYRLAALEKAGVFHAPLNAAAQLALYSAFLDVAGEPGSEVDLDVEGRRIRALKVARGVAWFDFSDLCDGPRGQSDYIELAKRFHTVLVSGVPEFGRGDADRRRRFTWLIDEFYDRRVKLVVSAESEIAALFAATADGAAFDRTEIERTKSRLIEMQTRRYLGEAHLG